MDDDLERLRQRLAVNGAEIADELLPVIALMAGPLFAGMDALAMVDFGSIEPFDPTRVLVADATASRR